MHPSRPTTSRPARLMANALIATAALLAGCTQMPAPVFDATTASGPLLLPNDGALPPWQAVNIRFKTPTSYRSDSVAGVPCIRAEANAAWSILAAPVPPSYAGATHLSWRWFIPAAIPDADPATIGKDDAPARVVVAFKGDRSRLDAADRATMNMARALGGVEMPFAAIQYIWDAKTAPETVLGNANTTRIKKIVVRQGGVGLASWQSFDRDVRADYRRAFPGEEAGEIESIGLMTDTDSLGGKAEACYADLALGG